MEDLNLKNRLWIEKKGKVLLGTGRVQLLKAIEEHGSISKAARSNNMSYKKAWTLVDSVNKSASSPIVQMSVGGSKGGGASLTEYGKNMIGLFDEIQKDLTVFLDEKLKKFDEVCLKD